MSDRELLELAAKAAGMSVIHSAGPDAERGLWAHGLEDEWNPLTDDGDALRLAVIAGIAFEQNEYFKRACALHYSPDSVLRKELFEPWGIDKFAATRRAIVRAAAEIGKAGA